MEQKSNIQFINRNWATHLGFLLLCWPNAAHSLQLWLTCVGSQESNDSKSAHKSTHSNEGLKYLVTPNLMFPCVLQSPVCHWYLILGPQCPLLDSGGGSRGRGFASDSSLLLRLNTQLFSVDLRYSLWRSYCLKLLCISHAYFLIS